MPYLHLFFLMMEQQAEVLAVCCSICCLLLKVHSLLLVWICQLQPPAVRSSCIFIWRVLLLISVPQIDAMINSSLKLCFVKINHLGSWVFLQCFPVSSFLWSTLNWFSSFLDGVHHERVPQCHHPVLIVILYIKKQCLLFCTTSVACKRRSPSTGNICYSI